MARKRHREKITTPHVKCFSLEIFFLSLSLDSINSMLFFSQHYIFSLLVKVFEKCFKVEEMAAEMAPLDKQRENQEIKNKEL